MAAISLLNPKAEFARAAQALAVNISAAKGIQDVMKTNLGPKGTMKMYVFRLTARAFPFAVAHAGHIRRHFSRGEQFDRERMIKLNPSDRCIRFSIRRDSEEDTRCSLMTSCIFLIRIYVCIVCQSRSARKRR